MVALAAVLFAVLAAVLALFQLAVAGGAPWGHLTQGGSRTGRLPPTNRVVAAVSFLLTAALAGIVLARAGALLPHWQEASRPWAWAVVALSALSLLANVASRSRAERRLWVPVAFSMLLTSVVVATSRA